MKLAASERSALDAVQVARGDDSLSDTLRALPEVWAERDALLRAALEPVRGKLTKPEVELVLDVCNGLFLLPDLLGSHLLAEVCDGIELNGMAKKHGIDSDHLVGVLRALPRSARVALELWTAGLWRRCGDEALWATEVAWLSTAQGA